MNNTSAGTKLWVASAVTSRGEVAAAAERGTVPLPRQRPRPDRRMGQDPVPERAGVEGMWRMQGMQFLERLYRVLVSGHDEPRPVGGGDARDERERRD